MKICEAHPLVVKTIHVGSFEDRVPVGGNIPVALIIRKDKDDIGVFARNARRRQRCKREQMKDKQNPQKMFHRMD